MAITGTDIPILSIRNLSKSFDGIVALEGLSLDLAAGKVTSVIGPNGSGKTTLFNILTGFWKADSGQVWLNGRNITTVSPYRRAKLGLGRTFQNIRLLPQLSVLDNVLIALQHPQSDYLWGAIIRTKVGERQNNLNQTRAMELLLYVGLEDKVNAMGGELSHGQRRLLEFARVLALNPKLLLLDEPMAGLFPSMVVKVKQMIREMIAGGRTVLFIEHNVDSVMDLSDRVVVLNEGRRIADNTPHEVQRDPAVIEAYFGRRYRQSSEGAMK